MKKLIAFALVLTMMLSMSVVTASAAAWDGTTASASLKGEGTAASPYLVESAEDLKYIIAMQMPSMMFVVSGSPNITVPTRIAVMGSNTPSTDAFVAPMLRVAMARDAVDTIVGSNARPIRLSHAAPPSMPAVIAVLERAIFPRNTIAPTVKA